MHGCGIGINSLLRKEAAVSTKLLKTVRKSSALTSGMRSEYENTTSVRPSRFLVVARQPPRVSPGKEHMQVSIGIY